MPSVLPSPVSLEAKAALVYVTYMKLRLLTSRLVEVDLADISNFTRHIDRAVQFRIDLPLEVN
jgi:ribosomal protein S3AE